MKSNKKIKIFVDCHVFDKGFQGTRSYIQGLYLELIKEKGKIFYFAATDIENLRSVFGLQDNIIYLKYRSKNPFFRLLFEIPFLINKNKINFAHFQYRVPPLKLCKYIVTIHDVLFEDFPEDFPILNRLQSFITYKFSGKISDIVFTVSNYSKTQILNHLKIKKVVVMPNGVDNTFFEKYDKIKYQEIIFTEYNISDYLIFVSRWEPRKNHHLLIESFAKLKLYENHFLVFIGDDTFKNKEYDKIYTNLNNEIKQRIIILKKLSFEKMLTLLRGASFAIYPSKAEGFGIPILESIAAKVPTIASNTTAMSDFEFMEQYSFDPVDKDDFNKKLKMVIKQKDENIDKKISIIKERYNWQLSAVIFNNEMNKFY